MEISQAGVNSFSPTSQGDVPAASRPAASNAASVSAATVEMPTKAVKAVKGAVNLTSLTQATDQLNQAIQLRAKNLQFTIDKSTGIHVVKVIDTQTNEVIRQFPSEDILAMAKALDQWQGLLRDKA